MFRARFGIDALHDSSSKMARRRLFPHAAATQTQADKMSEIHIDRDGTRWGPYVLDEVKDMAAAGQLVGTDLAWTEGMAEWVPLAQWPGVPVEPGLSAAAGPARAVQRFGGHGRPVVAPRQPGRRAPGSSYPGSPYHGPAPTSGLAIASLVLSIIALVGFVVWFLSIPLAVLAIVFGHITRSSVRRLRGRLGGGGMALAGLIMGYLSLAATGVFYFGLFKAIQHIGERQEAARPKTPADVAALRADFTTKLVRKERENSPAPEPADPTLQLMKYPGPLGPMAAYVSKTADGFQQLPALVWLSGGFGNSIGEANWQPGPPEDDQSATAFRDPGLVMLYPSLRGGNDNPGHKEGLFGEVEDVKAAISWLRKKSGVDPRRIYVGGHSTGGTLALLVAAASSDLRGVFAFGPVEDTSLYGAEAVPFSVFNKEEIRMRSPAEWLHVISCPTAVIEGTEGNINSLRTLRKLNGNPLVTFVELRGRDHFSVLQPCSKLLLARILADTGPAPNLPVAEALSVLK